MILLFGRVFTRYVTEEVKKTIGHVFLGEAAMM